MNCSLFLAKNTAILLMDDGCSITTAVADLCKRGRVTEQGTNLFTASSVIDSEIESLIEKSAHSCVRKPISLKALLQILEK